jgi:hypothetical protein
MAGLALAFALTSDRSRFSEGTAATALPRSARPSAARASGRDHGGAAAAERMGWAQGAG